MTSTELLGALGAAIGVGAVVFQAGAVRQEVRALAASVASLQLSVAQLHDVVTRVRATCPRFDGKGCSGAVE
jgi:hypothetical protein